MSSNVSSKIISERDLSNFCKDLDYIMYSYAGKDPENLPKAALRVKATRGGKTEEITFDAYAKETLKFFKGEKGEKRLVKMMKYSSEIVLIVETKNNILFDILDKILDFIVKRVNPDYKPLTYEQLHKTAMENLTIDVDSRSDKINAILEPLKGKIGEVVNSIGALGDRILDFLVNKDDPDREKKKDDIIKTAIVVTYTLLALAVAAVSVFNIVGLGPIGIITGAFAGLALEATLLSFTRKACLELSERREDPSFKFDAIMGPVAGVLDTVLSPIAKIYDFQLSPKGDITQEGIEQTKRVTELVQERAQEKINNIKNTLTTEMETLKENADKMVFKEASISRT